TLARCGPPAPPPAPTRPAAGDARPETLQALSDCPVRGTIVPIDQKDVARGAARERVQIQSFYLPGNRAGEDISGGQDVGSLVDLRHVVLATETGERPELAHVGSTGAEGTSQHEPIDTTKRGRRM